MTTSTKVKRDIHQEVTDKMIALLEQGNLPWEKPWKQVNGIADSALPYNAISRRNYTGINTLLLWSNSMHYQNNAWLTFKQAQQLGGNVKKGEKAEMVIFFKRLEAKDKDTGEKKTFAMLRHYYVFNVAQCENLRPQSLKPIVPPASPKGAVLEIAQAHNVNLQHGGDRACFIPSHDIVQMPHFGSFKSESAYSAVLAHELTHWTGHKTRLERDLSGMFGNEKYAKEELVAEMGSAFLLARLGIEYEARHHAAYLQSWLKGLKEDKKLIFSAAAAAQKASSYLLDEIETGTTAAEDTDAESGSDTGAEAA